MRLPTIVVSLLAVVLGSGCAGQSASYDYDQSVDFGKLRRWMWIPRPQEQPSGDPRIDNSLTRKRIESALSRALAAKGYEEADGPDVDFTVGYLVTVQKRVTSSGMSTSIGFGRYSRGSGVGISIGGPATPVLEYEEGTLFVDIRDHRSGDLLWRGSSSSRLDAASTPEQSEQAIDRIGAYADTGVQGLNIAFRPPVDWDALQLFIEDVMPEFTPAA